MNEEVPFLPILIGALGVLYFGYEVDRQRHKLRKVFNVFDKEESIVAVRARAPGADRSDRAIPRPDDGLMRSASRRSRTLDERRPEQIPSFLRPVPRDVVRRRRLVA